MYTYFSRGETTIKNSLLDDILFASKILQREQEFTVPHKHTVIYNII